MSMRKALVLGVALTGCSASPRAPVAVVARVEPVPGTSPMTLKCARRAEEEMVADALVVAKETVFARVRRDLDASYEFRFDLPWKTREEADAFVDRAEERGDLVRPLVSADVIDGATAAPVVSFVGETPSDAGGVGDGNRWFVLVVRVGCTWEEAKNAPDANVVVRETHRTPRGDRIFVATDVDGQCSSTQTLFGFRGAATEVFAKYTIPRSDMSGSVCAEQLRVERVTRGDILEGIRISTLAKNPDSDIEDWLESDALSWDGGMYTAR